ncbi:hypothetical protein RV12_GL002065 [Enterococcus quebecensis]|nr:hypothetical protein RV12_GL002065 [Enterococcus quebecensis]
MYQAELLNGIEGILVGKIEDFAASHYQQLVECKVVRNSEGVFQVDSQTLTNLAV